MTAAAWPTVTDVQNVLRVIAGNSGDDSLISQDLAAAIAWVTMRVDPTYTATGSPYFLPDPLFTAAQYEAARLYRRRDSVDGTIGWGDMGVVRVGPKDPDIETMMAPYLAVVFG
jgi:hypothetical protein